MHKYKIITSFAHVILWQAHKTGTTMYFQESLSLIQNQLKKKKQIKYKLEVRILGSSKHLAAVFQNL